MRLLEQCKYRDKGRVGRVFEKGKADWRSLVSKVDTEHCITRT